MTSPCADFHNNWTVNPRTGKRIQVGGPRYNELDKECGPPPGLAATQKITGAPFPTGQRTIVLPTPYVPGIVPPTFAKPLVAVVPTLPPGGPAVPNIQPTMTQIAQVQPIVRTPLIPTVQAPTIKPLLPPIQPTMRIPTVQAPTTKPLLPPVQPTMRVPPVQAPIRTTLVPQTIVIPNSPRGQIPRQELEKVQTLPPIPPVPTVNTPTIIGGTMVPGQLFFPPTVPAHHPFIVGTGLSPLFNGIDKLNAGLPLTGRGTAPLGMTHTQAQPTATIVPTQRMQPNLTFLPTIPTIPIKSDLPQIASPTRIASPQRITSPRMVSPTRVASPQRVAAAPQIVPNQIGVLVVSDNIEPGIRWGVRQQQQRSGEDRYQVKQVGPYSYFAVFDGHGGTYKMGPNHVADYCVNNLHVRLAEGLGKIDLNNEEEVKATIIQTFVDFDAEMYNSDKLYGTTCTIALVDVPRNKIYQVNLGDSRSIIFTQNNIISATDDHEPNFPVEKARIEAAGGFVANNRVFGQLAVARAFGDFDLKGNKMEPYDPIAGEVSAVPDIKVTVRPLNAKIILTSDAPYERDSFSDEDLVNLALNNENLNPDTIANTIVTTVRPKTTDDITIMYVRL